MGRVVLRQPMTVRPTCASYCAQHDTIKYCVMLMLAKFQNSKADTTHRHRHITQCARVMLVLMLGPYLARRSKPIVLDLVSIEK